jgi:hypothetical protein
MLRFIRPTRLIRAPSARVTREAKDGRKGPVVDVDRRNLPCFVMRRDS